MTDLATRLNRCAARMYGAAYRATQLEELWQFLNTATDQHKALSESPAGLAAELYHRAVLQEQILIVVRLFDSPGRRGAEQSDKISFPVVRDLLALPGTAQGYIEKARHWPGQASTGPTLVKERIADLEERLARLASEMPNRLQLLRDFRDEHLAHELYIEVEDTPRVRARYSYLSDMLTETRFLAGSVNLIVRGSTVGWGVESAGTSAAELWGAVSRGFALEAAPSKQPT